jgi:hypothetical protein
MKHYDPHTYRYPRTSMEAFGCDATQARAGWKYTNWQQIIVNGVAVGVMAATMVALMLAYFDVLVK